MSITLYSKFPPPEPAPRLGFRRMTEWCVNVGLSIILFLAAIILVQYVADKAIAPMTQNTRPRPNRARSPTLKKRGFRAWNNKGIYLDGKTTYVFIREYAPCTRRLQTSAAKEPRQAAPN